MKLNLRAFVAGLLCGGILIAAVWAGSVWWKSHGGNGWLVVPPSTENAAIYDACLLAQNGNRVACDALMRIVERDRAKGAYLKAKGATLLAAGYSKREVVDWAREQGGVGQQLSDAAGISLRDLQDGKY